MTSLWRIVQLILYIAVLALMPVAQANESTLHIEWSQWTTESTAGVDWHPDSRRLAVGTANSVFVLDTESRSITLNIPLPTELISPDTMYTPRLSTDGRFLATMPGYEIYLIDLNSGEVIRTIESLDAEYKPIYYTDVHWEPSGSRLAALRKKGYIDIYDLQLDEPIFTLDLSAPQDRTPGYNTFDWSPNDLFAAPIPQTYSIGFWNVTGELIEEYLREDQPYTGCSLVALTEEQNSVIVWNSDGSLLAVGGASGFAICSFEPVPTYHTALEDDPYNRYVGAAAWYPDSTYLATSEGSEGYCQIQLWNLSNLDNITSPQFETLEPNGCEINGIDWSPDGQYLAVASSSGLWVGRVVDNP